MSFKTVTNICLVELKLGQEQSVTYDSDAWPSQKQRERDDERRGEERRGGGEEERRWRRGGGD